MNIRVPVMEIMKTEPVTISPDSSISDAAALMKKHGIGSLIVVEDSRPVGIVTERDIVVKVVAQSIAPTAMTVDKIMSSPVISVHPHTEVAEAAKKMADNKIRRLAVVEDDDLVGILTEKDILKIWPQLIEVTREYSRIGMTEFKRTMSGYCELCGDYSDSLVSHEGQLLCSGCRER